MTQFDSHLSDHVTVIVLKMSEVLAGMRKKRQSGVVWFRQERNFWAECFGESRCQCTVKRDRFFFLHEVYLLSKWFRYFGIVCFLKLPIPCESNACFNDIYSILIFILKCALIDSPVASYKKN